MPLVQLTRNVAVESSTVTQLAEQLAPDANNNISRFTKIFSTHSSPITVHLPLCEVVGLLKGEITYKEDTE